MILLVEESRGGDDGDMYCVVEENRVYLRLTWTGKAYWFRLFSEVAETADEYEWTPCSRSMTYRLEEIWKREVRDGDYDEVKLDVPPRSLPDVEGIGY